MLINGRETEQLSVLDRGFQYGDGLFETLRICDGKPRHWALHMARLNEGCARLAIAAPVVEVLRTEAERLCSGQVDGVLKITVTRGQTQRGYGYTGALEPTRVLAVFPAPQFPASHATLGVKVRLCQTRLGSNPALAGIKHLNRLEQVLARAEWTDATIAEGLMRDNNNNIVEGTMSNLFCVQAGEDGPVLKTPLLEQCGVKGITRGRIMEAASATGIAVQETPLSVDELYQAQELFLCNTLIGIWPVRQLEEHCFEVGPVTQQLSHALESRHD
jgi:4-amino-4-deoxychorismate lyase